MTVSAVAEPPRLPGQWGLTALGLAAFAGGTLFLGADSWKHGALFVVGGLLGMSLYHAAFGFTAAYRNAFVRRDVSGVAAQLVMLAVAMLLFAPILAQGQVFGHGVVGAVAPVGVQVAVGSFLIGLGMQLGGGCGSGTLYTVGGGSTRDGDALMSGMSGGGGTTYEAVYQVNMTAVHGTRSVAEVEARLSTFEVL